MRQLLTTRFGYLTVILMLALTLGLALTPRAAVAGFMPTIKQSDANSKDLDTIRLTLENKKVAGTLASLGYDKSEIDERLAKLTPEEVSALAGQLDEAMNPAGSGVGIAIGVVVVVLVVIGILSIMGKRVVVSE
jgi:hypothetical protein